MATDYIQSRLYVAQQIAESRDTIGRSMVLLGRASPSTFAGRKTQEPFPPERDPMRRPDIQNLIASELQPPK